MGTAAVHGAILARYLAKDGPAGSGLGFPTAGEAAADGPVSTFTRGSTFWSATTGQNGEALLDHR